MQSPDGNQLWCPGQSLWSLIAEHVSGSELPEIRRALGQSLVDLYTEVHAEAEMCYDLWQAKQQQQQQRRPRQLADPPVVKELVRAEVKMLLETLRERVSRGQRDSEELVLRYKPETVNYALGHPDTSYRNTANPEGADAGSRPSSRCSVRSVAEDEIEAMKDKLNVIDIDQVVERLTFIMKEECEALKRLTEQIQRDIKLKHNKAEPTLAELKELRGAIQMDLELYPSSLAACPPACSPLPLKDLKNGFRLSEASEKTLRSLSTTSVRRPQPPPPRCHAPPRPPCSAPANKTRESIKPANSSALSQPHGLHRHTSATTGFRRTQTPVCSSGPANRHSTAFPAGPESEQSLLQTGKSLPPEETSAGISSNITSSPSCQMKTLSSHCTAQRPDRKNNLSQQTEIKNSPTQGSRNISTIAVLSSHCDVDTNSSNSTEHFVSTVRKSKTQKGTCGASTAEWVDSDRRKSTSESLPSCLGSRKSSHLGKDVKSLVASLTDCSHINQREVILHRSHMTSNSVTIRQTQ